MEGAPGLRCAIAACRGLDIDCPDGGCVLLGALGYGEGETAAVVCPIEEIAERARFDAGVVRTLDELRAELEHWGVPVSAARALRSRATRHGDALRRWPEVT